MLKDREGRQDAGEGRSYQKPLVVKSRVNLQTLTAQPPTSPVVTTTLE